jgi:cell division protein ZapD
MSDTTTYEHPMNERMRSFLRLEYLFDRAQYHTEKPSHWDSSAALDNILIILDMINRKDIRKELLHEIDRLTKSFLQLSSVPEVDNSLLELVLHELNELQGELQILQSLIAPKLRKNPFITTMAKRFAIPNSLLATDLPVAHHWFSASSERRHQDLSSWLDYLSFTRNAIALVLQLVRHSTPSCYKTAINGIYHQSMDAHTVCQLVQVSTVSSVPYYVEISGGKHRFTVRFIESDDNQIVLPFSQNVNFQLACCTL